MARLACLAVLALLGSVRLARATPTAEQAIDRVQQFYATISHVTAQFRESITNDTFATTKTREGTVWVKKPGMMRWHYLDAKQAAVARSILSSRTSLYVVDHEAKRVVKKDVQTNALSVVASFVHGTANLKSDFHAVLETSGKYGAKGNIVVRLVPKKPSPLFMHLLFVLDGSDYHVEQSILVEASNNVYHYVFSAPDYKTAIHNTWFDLDMKAFPGYAPVDVTKPPSRAP